MKTLILARGGEMVIFQIAGQSVTVRRKSESGPWPKNPGAWSATVSVERARREYARLVGLGYSKW